MKHARPLADMLAHSARMAAALSREDSQAGHCWHLGDPQYLEREWHEAQLAQTPISVLCV